MIVYRLEKDGKGPFYGDHHVFDLTDEEYEEDARRLQTKVNYTIYQWEDMSDFYYGCNSLKKLQDYFGALWRPTIAAGFRVKRYWVRRYDVRFSDGLEMAFRKDGIYQEAQNYERYLDEELVEA